MVSTNPKKLWALVLGTGILLWGYKGLETYAAYRVAAAEIASDTRLEKALGNYSVSFDWWLMAVRSPWEGDIRRFDFRLEGQKDSAVGSVELKKDGDWQVSCVHVVNGRYANQQLVGGCLKT